MTNNITDSFKVEFQLLHNIYLYTNISVYRNEKGTHEFQMRIVIKTDDCTYMHGFQFQMISFRSFSKEISTLDKYKKHSAGTCRGHMGMGPSIQNKLILQLKDKC
jgi:hypothetical protein